MRVLFVTHSFPRYEGDGAGDFVLRLARALVGAGADVEVIAPSAPGLEPVATVDGIRVTRFRYAPRSWETLAYEGTMAEQVAASLKGKVALGGFLLGARHAVLQAMTTRSPDVIHAHWWFPSGLAAAITPEATPLVVTLHGSDVRLALKSGLAPSVFRRVAKRAAAVTAVSSWLASSAEQLAPGQGVTVAPMPVEMSLFSAGPNPRARRLLFVGRLNAQKGMVDLLRALTAVPTDVMLDVVGDGPDRGSLESLASELGVSGRVKWHGKLAQRDLAPVYRTAFAVVIPSRDEGLGLVAAEALLSGAPVIAYRSGGLVDLVEDGVTGRLVTEGSVAELAAAITGLLATPNEAAAMGATGRTRMSGRFAPATAAETYSSIYQRVVAR